MGNLIMSSRNIRMINVQKHPSLLLHALSYIDSLKQTYTCTRRIQYHSGSCSFHFSFSSSTSNPHNSALLTTSFAFPTTGISIIFPSNVHAPLPPLSAFASAITTRTLHVTSSSPGANAFCTIST
ncbi:hypothetical protein ACMFMG_000783 [Clarireedia jacksonii]